MSTWRDWGYEELAHDDLRAQYGTILEILTDTDDNLKSLKEDHAILKAAVQELIEALDAMGDENCVLSLWAISTRNALKALVGEPEPRL